MKYQAIFLIALMVGSITAQIDASCANYALTSAQLDQFGPNQGGAAITFADPNVPGGFTTYNFKDNSGNLANNGNQIIITGVISPADGSSVPTWDVKMVFNKQSSGMPKQELKPNAYVPQGPVDPNTWQYYAIDPAQSSFIGHDGSVDGVTMNLNTFDNMPLQVGIGANGKNINNGASGWFSCSFSRNGQVFYTSTQVVDINVDINCKATPPPTNTPTQPSTTGTPSPTVVTTGMNPNITSSSLSSTIASIISLNISTISSTGIVTITSNATTTFVITTIGSTIANVSTGAFPKTTTSTTSLNNTTTSTSSSPIPSTTSLNNTTTTTTPTTISTTTSNNTTGTDCTWICVPNGVTTTGSSTPVTTAAGGTFPPRGTTAAGGSNDAGSVQVSKIIVAALTFLVLALVQ